MRATPFGHILRHVLHGSFLAAFLLLLGTVTDPEVPLENPAVADMVGSWRPTKGSAAELGPDFEGSVLVLRADKTCIMTRVPTEGDSGEKVPVTVHGEWDVSPDSGRDTYSIGTWSSSPAEVHGYFPAEVRGHGVPYSLYFHFGDHDGGDDIVFTRNGDPAFDLRDVPRAFALGAVLFLLSILALRAIEYAVRRSKRSAVLQAELKPGRAFCLAALAGGQMLAAFNFITMLAWFGFTGLANRSMGDEPGDLWEVFILEWIFFSIIGSVVGAASFLAGYAFRTLRHALKTSH